MLLYEYFIILTNICTYKLKYDIIIKKYKQERNEFMKKKGIAALLATIMLVSSFTVPTFARYDVEGSNYTFKDTTDLEIDYDDGNGNVVLTWPATDTEGNLIKDNPLKAEGQIQSNGNPTRGWTNPTNGMIIQYDGWLPDGTHNKVTNDNKPEHNVIMGLVDTPTEYPVYIKDPKAADVTTTEDAVKVAYIDTTVVATGFATAYQIQYSLDGTTWIEDQIVSTINHGKKLTRAKADGTLADDNKNTFFLEDQLTVPLAKLGEMEPETKYYIRIRAFDASKPASRNTPYRVYTGEFVTPAQEKLTPAFATVEGGGTYSQGGRGGDVYVVTNLTDSVSDPQPGSLRYGLLRMDRSDGNKLAPRTIVFNVGGTINIDENASKSERRMNITSNTTILGQTAPGEGITIAGSSMKFTGENIIVRYMHFRLGDGYDLDAATATGKYIVIDHCSFGWGVDEVFSAKEILNSSIQYNIISSGLAVPAKNAEKNSDAEVAAGESEAKHGMGSIINGYEVSYTHNLWAHNGTRNPRFEGGFEYEGIRYENKIDYANNVIYNWGHNSTYGGERGKGQMNFVGNYYKPGPETLEKVKYQLFDCDVSGEYIGSYYIADNVLTSSEAVTSDNTLGFVGDGYNQLTSPVELQVPYTATSAQEAYMEVLNNAGASYFRDPHDQRLVNEVISGKGGFINSDEEAGGANKEVFTSTYIDSDNDGLPDDYETANGLNPSDASDSADIIQDETSIYNGYSNIEVYAGNLVEDWGNSTATIEPYYPHAEIISITDENNTDIMAKSGNTTLVAGKTYTISFSEPVTGDILLNDITVATANSNGTVTITPDRMGVYNLSCLMNAADRRAYTYAVPVTVVNGEGNLDGFTSTDIGSVGAKGADNLDVTTGTLISQGAGRIGRTNTSSTQNPDAFHYNYKLVQGDFEFTAKIDNLAKIDYLQKSGIMARASLDPGAEFYMAALTYIKGEDYAGATDVTGETVKAKNIMAVTRTIQGNTVAQRKFMGIPTVRDGETPNSGYGRLTRVGNTITISASLDGQTWYELFTWETSLPEVCYIGFATSAAQDTSEKVRYNVTAFSDITINATDVNTVLGDADCNGIVSAEDAALVHQYVLDRNGTNITAQGILNALVVDNSSITATNCSHILSKALDNNYKFPVEVQ